MPHNYNLGFISDTDLFEHVKETLGRLKTSIDFQGFQKNIVDPIKLTFEIHAYKRTPQEAIENEIARQLGKTVENAVGAFHQGIFKHIDGWSVPVDGVDVMNNDMTIFGEIKNKYNTMNSGSAQSVFNKLQGVVIANTNATAYLIEVIAKKSADEPWSVPGHTLMPQKARRLRRISIDLFYEKVTGNQNAFKDLCSVLGLVVDDVLDEYPSQRFNNTVLAEMTSLNPDLIKAIFLSSFSTYNGFNDFNERTE